MSDLKGPPTINRRQWFSSTLAVGSCMGMNGCLEQPETRQGAGQDTGNPTGQELEKLPLRLLMLGSQADADILSRGWNSVSDQPLKIIRLGDGGRQKIADHAGMIRKTRTSDLLWFPSFMLAELVSENVIVPVRDPATLSGLEKCFPAVRNGLSSYAGETYGVPLGPAIATVMSAEPVDGPLTWSDYEKLVEGPWQSNVGEPTAKGWAAMMFLWRCIGNVERWLFDQNTFAPLITSSDSTEALSLMASTCQKYNSLEWTPSEIYHKFSTGELAAGITFPHPGETDAGFSGAVFPLPGWQQQDEQDASSTVLFDAMTPLVGMASSCRQTAASKVFLNWIFGSESSRSVRDHIAGVFDPKASDSGQLATARAGTGEYKRVRSEVLQSPITSEGLTILQAGDYYHALDEGVRRCLEGKRSASESMADVASQWKTLTKRVGTEEQLIAWRRARGLRA